MSKVGRLWVVEPIDVDFTSWWRRMALFPSEAMYALLDRNCQSLLGAHGRHALGEKHVARFGLLARQASQRT